MALAGDLVGCGDRAEVRVDEGCEIGKDRAEVWWLIGVREIDAHCGAVVGDVGAKVGGGAQAALLKQEAERGRIEGAGAPGGKTGGDAGGAALVVGFAKRPRVNVQGDGEGVRWIVAGAEGVAQAIVKLAHCEQGVGLEGLSRGAERQCRTEQQRGTESQDMASTLQRQTLGDSRKERDRLSPDQIPTTERGVAGMLWSSPAR